MIELTKSAITELQSFPRVCLGHDPTPLEYLPRLSAEYKGTHIYVKRDDCTGLGLGGNKVRQLEYYLGDAIVQGCDTVLSTGPFSRITCEHWPPLPVNWAWRVISSFAYQEAMQNLSTLNSQCHAD